jgi:RNA polymerase sigma-70 factor (ECF subfamily)
MKTDDTPEMDALRRREPDAVESWFLEHADRIYTFAFYRLGRDREAASDAVQETFTTALDRIERFDPERGAMSVWLTYLARNCIRTARRRSSRWSTDDSVWHRIDQRLVPGSLDHASEALPPETIERRETAELVQMALAHLPESYRWALVEHYFERRSLADMRRGTTMTDSAVKSLLHRARSAFRTAFRAIAEELEAGSAAAGRTP